MIYIIVNKKIPVAARVEFNDNKDWTNEDIKLMKKYLSNFYKDTKVYTILEHSKLHINKK